MLVPANLMAYFDWLLNFFFAICSRFQTEAGLSHDRKTSALLSAPPLMAEYLLAISVPDFNLKLFGGGG